MLMTTNTLAVEITDPQDIIKTVVALAAEHQPVATKVLVGGALLKRMQTLAKVEFKPDPEKPPNMIWGLPVEESWMMPPGGYAFLDKRGAVIAAGMVKGLS